MTRLLEIIDSVYAAGSGLGDWPQVLDGIADLAGAEVANMMIHAPGTGQTRVISPRTDPAFQHRYFTEWIALDPTVPATLAAPVGRIVTLADSGRESFLSSAFRNEIWRQSGHGAERLRSSLARGGDLQVGFGMIPHARRDEITAHMLETYKALLPHLIRSVDIQRRLRLLELSALMMPGAGTGGSLIVNGDGRALAADPAAETILGWGAPLCLRGGCLEAMAARDTGRLLGMIRSCLPADTGHRLRGGSAEISYPGTRAVGIGILPVPPEARRNFPLDVVPNAAPVAIVQLTDLRSAAESSLARAQRHYGLTRAQAAVALECTRAGSRAEIATNLSLKDATVRSHLSSIYLKTRTRSMAALVRLLYEDGVVLPRG